MNHDDCGHDPAPEAPVADPVSLAAIHSLDFIELTLDEGLLADAAASYRASKEEFWLRAGGGGKTSPAQGSLIARAELAFCKATNRCWLGVPPSGVAVIACQHLEAEAAFAKEQLEGAKLVVFAHSEDGRERTRFRIGWLTPCEVADYTAPAPSMAWRGGPMLIPGARFRPSVAAAADELAPRAPVTDSSRTILLEKAEENFIGLVSSIRTWQNLVQKKPNAYGLPPDKRDNVNYCVSGARAEAAVAKLFNMHWSGNLGDHAAPDVGGLSVRSSRKDEVSTHPDLPGKPSRDRDDDIVVMVQEVAGSNGSCGRLIARGWLHGYETKDMRWFRPDLKPRECNRVPFSAARPLHTIPDPTKVEAIRRWRRR